MAAWEVGGRNRSDMSTDQGKSSIASNHQKLEDAKKDSFLETLGELGLDLTLLTSRTVSE